jgi:hypothetical protein
MGEILDLAFDLFVLWLLYKLIFEFIVPVFQSAKNIRNKVQEAQVRMQQNQNQYNQNTYQQTTAQSTPKSSDEGEYIDFEEVKD